VRSTHARSLTIDQVVVEDVYSQAEKRLRPAPVLYFKETKKGLVLSGTNQDALQALFGDDVTTCCGSGFRQEGVARADAGARRRPGANPSRSDGRDPRQGRAGEQGDRAEGGAGREGEGRYAGGRQQRRAAPGGDDLQLRTLTR
jgi:hypothetical protein